MSLVENLIVNTVETLASLPEVEWDSVIRFLAPSLLQNRPNDFVRILMDRAILRAKDDGNPTRHFQLIMRDQGLELQYTHP